MHALFDQVRIVPTRAPWSVWVFFAQGVCAGWSVNLEALHVREVGTVHTSDRVLDVVVSPDRTAVLKDQHELALAVSQGVFPESVAASIEADARAVLAVIDAWGPPFCDGWESFRPDPAWPIPSLPPLVDSSQRASEYF